MLFFSRHCASKSKRTRPTGRSRRHGPWMDGTDAAACVNGRGADDQTKRRPDAIRIWGVAHTGVTQLGCRLKCAEVHKSISRGTVGVRLTRPFIPAILLQSVPPVPIEHIAIPGTCNLSHNETVCSLTFLPTITL